MSESDIRDLCLSLLRYEIPDIVEFVIGRAFALAHPGYGLLQSACNHAFTTCP
jgi:hypothetical protein